eukprot:TRINITY_DN3923_c0_g1_i1.p4 TRINITY_DN3923_c0_g1~~TRINITY_DN3923_c0_g1_i1.p4  ORF type:complete len:111 (-),score=15.15 TRINITY_DN3923_c0_g1_i1:16-348(-)
MQWLWAVHDCSPSTVYDVDCRYRLAMMACDQSHQTVQSTPDQRKTNALWHFGWLPVVCTPLSHSTFGTCENKTQNLSLIHISEPTRLLSISYAVFCLKKKKKTKKRLRCK